MTVINAWVGAASPDGGRVVAKVDGAQARLLVADNPGMSGPVVTDPVSATGQGIVSLPVSGLDSDTRYWWQIEVDSTPDTATTGRLRTHPTIGAPVSFTFAVGNCAQGANFPGEGDVLAPGRVSNHPTFAEIINRDPLFHVHLGDLHYYDLGSGNHGISGGASLANYRRAYDDVLLQPNQHLLYRMVPQVILWDDHDRGPNDNDRTFSGAENAAQAYRERVPHYPLPHADGTQQAFQVGRTLFIADDVRTFRDPNGDPQSASKTMLGSAQMAWIEQLLTTTSAEFLVFLDAERAFHIPDVASPTSGTDHWGGFSHNRQQLIELFGDTGFLGRMLIINGDFHHMGMNFGGHQFGAMPIYQFATYDSSSTDPEAPPPRPDLWDVSLSGAGRYGTVRVLDGGAFLSVQGVGWLQSTPQLEHSFTVATGDPPPPSVGTVEEFAEVVSGSHRMLIEAIVVDGFQTGWEPTGTPLEVLGGDVQYDAHADIFATLELDVAGVDEAGASLFPRRPDMLLAPYGTEIFVRRGVDLGGAGVLWSPLGYFQIRTPEQDDSPYGTIRISGQDRDAGLAEARVLTPRTFAASRTVGSVVAEIVGEVYPEAVVLFDDDTAFRALGRTVVLEEDRVPVLRELADSYGKLVFWDGEGILRFESPPDEDTISWDIAAGVHGVLVTSGRRVTRDGVFNGVRATGEGDEGDEDQVMAVAIDSGPNSPTRWAPTSEGGFGFVPRFYASPLISTEGQALAAARTMLSRGLGAPYSVDFGTVVNPALRPHHRVRITQQDGNREWHIVDRCTVPLDEDSTMTGATREVTQAVIGALIT